MLALILLMFIAGILTFLAPCTLPVLPAYLAFNAQQTKAGRVTRTIAFGLGLSLVLVVLGVLAGSLGLFLADYKRHITIFSGILLISLGVMILLGIEIPGFAIKTTPKRTFIGTFLFGVIFGISWSGCIGPIVGLALIIAANTQTAIGGGVLLFVYALGLLTPLIIVSYIIDRSGTKSRIYKLIKGKTLSIGSWNIQSTMLIAAVMLIILGSIFLFGFDYWLAKSPLIDNVFDLEEKLNLFFGI